MLRRALESCRLRSRHLVAAGTLLSVTTTAHATWSIVLIDTRTGEVALGSATCLTNFDLQAGTPVLLTGIGGATAQSFVDTTSQNRTFIRDHLIAGTHPETIIDLLADFDPGHQTRQYGIADTMGGTATFSGNGAGDWKGGVTGRVGDIVYAIQGNVLTGEPVVLMAEQAVINTPGDLAAKMMAGMEAARSMGGDGRCSCSPQDPEACGAPPPKFDKSAHIAYMLIARTGDVDLCNGSYKAGSQPWALDSGDLDGDGLLDIVVADRPGQRISVLRNQSIPGVAQAIMSEPTFYPAVGSPLDVALGDFNRDANLDLAQGGDDQFAIRFGNGDATFGNATAFPTDGDPDRIEVIDINGDEHPDLGIVLSSGSIFIGIGDANGTFADNFLIEGASNPTSLEAADLDGDGDTDLAVTDTSLDVVLFFLNTAGSFDLAGFEFVGANPADVAAADLDDDGDQDLVVANNSDASVTVMLKNEDLSYTQTDYTTWNGPALIDIRDLDADGILDIVALSNANRFGVLTGTGAGNFVVDPLYPTLGNNGDMALEDFDDDGDLDVAIALRSPAALYFVPGLADGTFNTQLGCGAGDHWMEFNIAFQAPQNPDPVFQLMDLYDEWRADLVGRPDAVQSSAVFDPETIPADSESTTILTVTPFDWQGMRAIDAVLGVSVDHAPGSAGLGTARVLDIGDDAVTIEVTAGIKPGLDIFRVTLDDGIRPVILMPDPSIDYDINVDFNGDGEANVLDFVALQLAFVAGDQAADMDGDGMLTILDFVAYTKAFQGG